MPDKIKGHNHVCPWWFCYTFDNPFRRLLHNHEAILKPYVQSGNHVIDVGAGMGSFTIPLARLVGYAGHVTAIDIQAKMLSTLTRRAKKSGVSEIIITHLASPDSLGYHIQADFILAFWSLHEVPDQRRCLSEIYDLLKPNGLFLLAEPKIHVPEKYFFHTLKTAKDVGFFIKEKPEIRISHSAVLTKS